MTDKIKEKIYIVGPVSGIENWREPFVRAKKNLEEAGFIVLSPLDYPDGLTQREYMMLSVQNVFIANKLYTLPGSRYSKGATAEIALAKSIGTEILY